MFGFRFQGDEIFPYLNKMKDLSTMTAADKSSENLPAFEKSIWRP